MIIDFEYITNKKEDRIFEKRKYGQINIYKTLL